MPPASDIAFVVVTHLHPGHVSAEKMRQSGAEAYLCKTGSPARLVEAVRAARH